MAIGDVRLTLGGQERLFKFRLQAWAALEDQGFSLDGIVTQMQQGRLPLKAVQVLVWAMLHHAMPAPTMLEIGEWVGGENVEAVMATLGEAIKDAFPQSPDPPPAPGLVADGTGPAPAS